MDKEEQIRVLAQELAGGGSISKSYMHQARKLYKAGYRKMEGEQSVVTDAFVKLVDDIIKTEGPPPGPKGI